MAVSDHVNLEEFMAGVERRNPHQTEFIQAVREVAEDVFEFIEDKEKYHTAQILRRMAEPDRVVSFRVCWEDDKATFAFNADGEYRTTTPLVPIKADCASTPA